MKASFFSTALLAALLGASAFAAPPARNGLYGGLIIVETGADKTVRDASVELADWLKRISGTPFVVADDLAKARDPGIILTLASSPQVAEADRARLADKGREAFLLRSEPRGRLWIVGNSSLALRHGVFSYLDQLGCRWFFPNDHWTIIPSLRSIEVAVDRVESPAFRGRDFAGSGGFGGVLTIDPKRSLQARWEAWKIRNRFGGDSIPGGHAGQAFNIARKKELLEHPEYLAETGGKRQPYAGDREDVMFCHSNPELRRLYIDWTLERLARGGPNSWAVSVEPSDGNGQCDCAECRKIGNGSASDKVFFLANETARAVAAAYPGKKVTLLAYNEHAAPPSFALEPNVLVYVTPYGFNRTGLAPEALITLWGSKAAELGLYDYWAIPDWSNCLPGWDYRELTPVRLRFWHSHAVRAFTGESSYSAGNVGLAWYVASRVMWNPETDVSELLDDFFAKSFGPAGPPMRRMLERWRSGGDDYAPGVHELALSFRDLQEARRLTSDRAIRDRVNDFALYVQYLRCWHDYRGPNENNPAAKPRGQAADDLVSHCWRIYESAMVHSYRMHLLIANRYEKDAPRFDTRWPLYKKAEAWDSLKPVTDAEIGRWIEDGVKTFAPVEFDARSYSTNIVPLAPPAPPWTNWVSSPSLACGQECLFWAAPGVERIDVRFACGRPGPAFEREPPDRIAVTDPAGRPVFEKIIPADGEWQTLTIPTAAPGLYKMTIYDQKSIFHLKVPANLPFVLKGGFLSTDLSPKVYFYVPKGLKRIAVQADSVLPFTVSDPTGKPAAEKMNSLAAADVPEGMDGKIWSMRGFKSWTPFRTLNVPALFALSPEGMMVPAEVIP